MNISHDSKSSTSYQHLGRFHIGSCVYTRYAVSITPISTKNLSIHKIHYTSLYSTNILYVNKYMDFRTDSNIKSDFYGKRQRQCTKHDHRIRR